MPFAILLVLLMGQDTVESRLDAIEAKLRAPAFPAYADACCTKGMLVTFVGTEPREVPGVTVCQARSLKGFSASCIVISENGYWLRTLPASATNADIKDSLTTAKGVSPLAAPFVSPRLSAGPDGRGESRGLRFHGNHNCPNCGTLQTRISGRGPGGTHTHQCSRCGTTWYH